MRQLLSHKAISALLTGGLLTGVCVSLTGCALLSANLASLPHDYADSMENMLTQQQLLTHIETETELLILDVRTSAEYASGHIPGAINIPIQELSQRLDELADYDVQKPIVLYCEQGVRADRGKDILQEAGFVTVQQLEGDMKAWRAHNRPIARASENGIADMRDSPQPSPDSALPVEFESQWIVRPDQAISLIQQGAVLLDAQGKGLGLKRFPGAKVVSWQQFSQTESPHRGKLLEDHGQLSQQLQDLGISRDRPVVVFANPPQGWGEDGRIVWMLRTLGHTQAVMVDGGIRGLLTAQAQLPDRVRADSGGQGDFIVQPENRPSTNGTIDWAIQRDELQALLDHSVSDTALSALPSPTSPSEATEQGTDESPLPILIDTREPREYAGETPYGEQRGGHVPGAIHLYFKDLMTEDGYLLPEADLRGKLQTYGITPDRRAIAYCTGGIRSGWLTAVLVHYGYPVENYAGSMWEWSVADPERYPLTR